MGETGAGKTTLGYLVARLYEPQEGRVTIDGVDVRDASLESLAATVGVVSQETYLFHATVRENLRFARPDATDEEIEEAARTARIHDLIASLPDGYDTVVGERGYRFSGGEKQRMAIARTILRNPPVLVLDEATSSLDTQTEAAVQAELERLSEGRTTITIAHRLSTVRDADQIVVLDHGRSSSGGRTRSCSSAAGCTRRSSPGTSPSSASRADLPARRSPAGRGTDSADLDVLQRDRPDPDHVAVLKVCRRDPAAVQIRAVRAAVVEDPCVATVADDDGVGSRYALVLDPDIGGEATTDVCDLVLERDQPRLQPLADGEVRTAPRQPLVDRPAARAVVEPRHRSGESAVGARLDRGCLQRARLRRGFRLEL